MFLNLTGDFVDAETAYQWGLVDRVVPGAEVAEAAVAIAGRIAAQSPHAVAVLCALPLAVTACGGGDDGGGGSGGAQSGEELYRQYACASCHSLDGSKGTGPTVKGLADSTVKLEGGKEVTADAAYLEKAITDPDADVTEGYNAGLMKASIDGFDLGDKPEDVQKLVEFIQGVK